MNSILTMGVDIGSSASKCIILQNGENIVSKAVVPVGAGTSGPGRAMGEALAACGKSSGDITFVCATGYGRNSVKEADIPDIIDGIHHSIASKTAGLVKRVGVTPLVAMTGGVATDSEVVRILSEELNTPIQVSPLSVLCGALGAALYAYDSCSKKS